MTLVCLFDSPAFTFVYYGDVQDLTPKRIANTENKIV